MQYGSDLWKTTISFNLKRQLLSNNQEIETFPDMPQNLYAALQTTTALHPAKTAIVDNYGHPCNYTDLKNKVDAFSAFLRQEMGVKRGSRTALMLYNSLEFCVAFLALIKLGAITIPLPTKYKEQEVKSLADKAEAQYVICDFDFQSWFIDYEKAGKGLIIVKNTENGYALPSCRCFMPTDFEARRDDTALLMFTSGTTSQSKGVVIKNYNIMHAVCCYQKILGITERDITVIPIPMYHITGLAALLGLFVYVGGTLYLHKYFNAKRVLSCILENQVTFVHASPTVFSMLLEESDNYPILPSLQKLACGSSNMPKKKLLMMHSWLPDSVFHTVYGLTETTSPAAIFPGDAATSIYAGSSGLPIPGTIFCILNEKGEELPNGQIGEIWISGTVVLDSYYNALDSHLRDGWLGTGDMGYFNEKGYLFIVDRKKDMINRGGEKIWSFDVENEIYKIQGVEEAAVCGIPDDTYGEIPVAAVKISADSKLTEQEIQKKLTGKIAKYKIPDTIMVLREIPVTPNGKVDKKALKKIFTKSAEQMNG